MQKFLNVFLLVLLFSLFGLQRVRAQAVTAATPYSLSVTGTLANCPVAAVGSYQYCFTTTGIYQALNVATWSLATGSGTAPSLTINGTTKTLPASFTIAVAAPSVSAPTIASVTPVASAPTATAPAVTVN